MVDFIDHINQTYDLAIDYVPVIEEISLPETCDELLEYAGGESFIDGGMREGIVLRSMDGMHSFKAVDNSYLFEYHAN